MRDRSKREGTERPWERSRAKAKERKGTERHCTLGKDGQTVSNEEGG